MNSNSGVCITISDIHDKTALQVSEILTDISKELKVSTLSRCYSDIYARPIEHNNAKVTTLVNPWAYSTDRKKDSLHCCTPSQSIQQST